MKPEREQPIRWEPTLEVAQQVALFARDSSLNARFQWNPANDEPARLLEQPEEGDLTRSAEWVILNPGDTIYRLNRDEQDSPLRVKRQAPLTAPFEAA